MPKNDDLAILIEAGAGKSQAWGEDSAQQSATPAEPHAPAGQP